MNGVLESKWGRRLTLVLLGVTAGLGQAPTDLWFVTILALAAILALFRTSSTIQAAFGTGWWSGLGYFAFSLRWIVEPFLVDAATYGWIAPFALVLMAGGAALFWGAAGYVAYRFCRPLDVGFVATFSLVEIARSLILTGFPWALVGHIWIETPLALTAALWGPHGLTLIALLLALSILRLVSGAWLWAIAPAGAAIAFLVLSPPTLQTPADAPLIRIVQPNIPQQEKWDPRKKPENFARLLQLSSLPSGDPDLVVWPETALAEILERAGPSIDTISDLVGDVPLITGVQRRARDDIYHNSLIMIETGGEVTATYDKQHLVPFGEYFPGGELAARMGLRGFASSQGFGFTPGETDTKIDIPNIGLARPLICYEGIFSEELTTGERPDFLLLITNDAWFGKGAGPQQHLAQARLRSIEQGLPMVRAANTGISAMIDPYGRLISTLALDEQGVLDVQLPQPAPATLYARHGDILAMSAALMLLLTSILRMRRNPIDRTQTDL
ncbi:apolipoprotein N-acyltransferase [Cognatiyoonia sediminum]|uniref:Apolipoprotein N-acyltransferase n=1 Tax=Cognatiyoonia sediminum TaxID=1508389 RepID=A0A1M5PKR4_9RHOB|nr:apolipoprotein N-acyltransferase [Cognatiyoonia sediminum]SHH02317.1 apolipoprotein N-acyltransferase [Cognatiyoonia sediminum]